MFVFKYITHTYYITLHHMKSCWISLCNIIGLCDMCLLRYLLFTRSYALLYIDISTTHKHIYKDSAALSIWMR